MTGAWEYLAGGIPFQDKDKAVQFLIKNKCPMAVMCASEVLGIKMPEQDRVIMGLQLDTQVDDEAKHELFDKAYTALGGHAIFTRLENMDPEDNGVLGTRTVGVRILR